VDDHAPECGELGGGGRAPPLVGPATLLDLLGGGAWRPTCALERVADGLSGHDELGGPLDDRPRAVAADGDGRTRALERRRRHDEPVPPRARGHEGDDVGRRHRPIVRVQDREGDPLRRPAVEVRVATPRLVQLLDGQALRRGRPRRRGGRLGAEAAGWAEAQAERPQVELVIVRIERIQIPVAIHRWPGRATPPEREGGIVGVRHDTRRGKRLRDLAERHRSTALEQRDDQERVGVRLWVVSDGGQGRDRDAQALAVAVGRANHRGRCSRAAPSSSSPEANRASRVEARCYAGSSVTTCRMK